MRKSALLTLAPVSHGFCGLADPSPDGIVRPKQVHGTEVLVLEAGSAIRDADAIITEMNSAIIGVSTADCLPILASSKDGRIIGACHAGWRGLTNNIVLQFLESLTRVSQKKTGEFIFAIGPSICSKHFVVQDDVIRCFQDSFALMRQDLEGCFQTFEDRWTVDLRKLCSMQLKEKGVSEVEDLDICTVENSDLASYRRDKKIPQSNIAWIKKNRFTMNRLRKHRD